MRRYKFSFLVLFALALVVVGACHKGSSPTPPGAAQKPLLLVSITPYRFFVEEIAGEGFEVETLVPAGANPHSFEPTARQMKQIEGAKCWFRIGEPFEEKLLPLLERQNKALRVADLRAGIPLLPSAEASHCPHCAHDALDRHIWLSPRLASLQAEAIERHLALNFPEKEGFFKENLASLQGRLAELDEEVAALLGPLAGRVILVSHPAFGYFCHDYGLEQLSIEYEGKDPRPHYLETVLQKASSEGAELAIALPQYNNRGAQMIAEKLRLPIRWIDPYSASYFETIRTLALWIADPYAKKEP